MSGSPVVNPHCKSGGGDGLRGDELVVLSNGHFGVLNVQDRHEHYHAVRGPALFRKV
jgi:hypothetical protein